MSRIDELVTELRDLPVEGRIRIMNAAMESLNPTDAERDKRWGEEARRRLDGFRAGEIEAKEGDAVFTRLLAKRRQ